MIQFCKKLFAAMKEIHAINKAAKEFGRSPEGEMLRQEILKTQQQ